MFELSGVWAIANDKFLRLAMEQYEEFFRGGGLPSPARRSRAGRLLETAEFPRSGGARAGGARLGYQVRGVAGWTGSRGLSGTSSTAVIPVSGLITQHPTVLEAYGLSTSAARIEAAIRTALASPDVAAVVLRIDSQGGQLQGLPQLAEFLLRVRGGEKPIIAHADSNALSAAYVIQACCTEAWASPLAMVGALGTFVVHTSETAMDEQLGIKRTMIKLPAGKALGWDGADLSDEGRRQFEALIAAGYRAIIGAVAKGRKVGASVVQGKSYGQGWVLDGAAAAAAGMVDGVRSFEDTLAMLGRRRPSRAAGSASGRSLGARAEGTAEAAADIELELERLRLSLRIH